MLHTGKMESKVPGDRNRAVHAHVVAHKPANFGTATANNGDAQAVVRNGMDGFVRRDRSTSGKGSSLAKDRQALWGAFEEHRSAKTGYASDTRKQYSSRNQEAASAKLLECYAPSTKVFGLDSLLKKGESPVSKPPENRR